MSVRVCVQQWPFTCLLNCTSLVLIATCDASLNIMPECHLKLFTAFFICFLLHASTFVAAVITRVRGNKWTVRIRVEFIASAKICPNKCESTSRVRVASSMTTTSYTYTYTHARIQICKRHVLAWTFHTLPHIHIMCMCQWRCYKLFYLTQVATVCVSVCWCITGLWLSKITLFNRKPFIM